MKPGSAGSEHLEVQGFRASGVSCGIKGASRDVALITSDPPASLAGVFTRSTVPGAPVVLSRDRARAGRASAIIINSGNANVATGRQGMRDADEMTRQTAAAIGRPIHEVLVASTGVIGQALPMKRMRCGIQAAVEALAADGLAKAADAIRTTDTFSKSARASGRLAGRSVELVGIAKGSGMIEPNMATMLSFILTDAAASPAFLRRILKRVADRTFNRLSVDGESSTSDMVLLLANGLAGQPRLVRDSDPGAPRFEAMLEEVSTSLARDVARDGEGATKLVTVEVGGARTVSQAEHAARRIANSPLVKTAIFGADPNWGRILQTLGAGRVQLDLARTRVRLCGVDLYKDQRPAPAAALRRAQARMKAADEITIEVSLGVGRKRARIWTCDLSYDYVRINAEYTT